MVNEEHVRYMIKMAVFDKHDGKECRPMTQYSRHDYVSMQMIRSLIAGTVTYALLLALIAIYRVEELLEGINTMNIRGVLTFCILGYLAFMIAYEVLTYVIAQKRYSAGRKKVKQYYNNVRKMNLIYEREERLKMPVGGKKEKELRH